jgi:hypothetical protein
LVALLPGKSAEAAAVEIRIKKPLKRKRLMKKPNAIMRLKMN